MRSQTVDAGSGHDSILAAGGAARILAGEGNDTITGGAGAMTVEGGAHHWPGGRKARMGEGKTQEIDANTEILRVFAANR